MTTRSQVSLIGAFRRPGLFISTCAVAVALFTQMGVASAATITVPGDQPTIDAAVSAASNGDTIALSAGTYDEGAGTVTINKSLTIQGPNAGVSPNTGTRGAEAIIQGSGTVYDITSPTATVVFRGLEFETTGAAMRSDAVGATITLQQNIFTAPTPGGTVNDGMYFDDVNLTVNDNLFTSFDTPNADTIQMGVATLPRTGTISITNNTWHSITSNGALNLSDVGGTISGNTFDGVAGYGVLVANNASLVISGNTFNNISNPTPSPTGNYLTLGAGVRLYDASASTVASITGNTFSNSYLGVAVRAGSDITGAAIAVNNNTFTSNTTNILNAGTGTLDATNNYWGSAAGPLYSIDGDVNYRPWFTDGAMTTTSTGISIGTSQYTSIQSAVNTANPGDTINVAAGEYNEDVTVDKSVTINGAQAGVAAAATSTGTVRTGTESTVNRFYVTANNVVIDGFTMANAGTNSQISVEGSSPLSDVVVRNNIFDGYNNVGLVTLKAGNVSISRNLFKDPLPDTEAIQVKDFSAGTQGCDGTSVTDNVFDAATTNGAADVTLSCTDSQSSNITISGNYSSGLGSPGGPSFAAFSGVTGGVSITNNTVNATANSGSLLAFAGDISGTVTIDGNTLKNGGSSAISIHGGDGWLGTDDPANTGSFSISNNTLTGNVHAISIATGALDTGASVKAHVNDISGNSGTAVSNSSSMNIDAAQNWWGSDASTTIEASFSGDVTYKPWYTTSAMTELHFDATNTGSDVRTTTSVDVSETSTTTAGTVTMDMPAGTTVIGDTSWDGTIDAPTVVASSTPSVSGQTTTPILTIQVGDPNISLHFDNPVSLRFEGQAGKEIGWQLGTGAFHVIDTVCSSNSAAGLSVSSNDCKIDDGADLVVWTKHFTTFTVYTQTATQGTFNNGSSGGGGGGGGAVGNGPVASSGGGGGGSSVSTPASTPVTTPATTQTGGSTGTTGGGQVLGAATYNFRSNLTMGSRGADVSALQQLLISMGYSIPAGATGYFGAQTRAAVAAYQKAHNITPAVGYVGSITRASLNAGTTPTQSDEQRSLLLQSLTLQLNNLMARLNALTSSTTVH